MAEKYQLPVIILSDQYIADSSATVRGLNLDKLNLSGLDVREEADKGAKCEGEYLRYKYTENGISPRLYPGNESCFVTADSDEHNEQGMITESSEVRTRMMDKRMKKLKSLELELQEPEFLGVEDFDTLIVGWGSTYGPIAEAVEILNGLSPKRSGNVGALVFGDVFPLPKAKITELAKRAKRIINVEQNATGQMAGLIREYTGVEFASSILKYDGRQISADEIVGEIISLTSKEVNS